MLRSTDLPDASFLRDVLALDEVVYPAQWQGTYESAYSRYQANQDVFSLLYDVNKLIGYICAFPIKTSLCEKMQAASHSFDDDVLASDIEVYETGNHYVLYIISIVISPEYQKYGLSLVLTHDFCYDLLKKRKEKIFVDKLLATSVSAEGKRLLENLGFEFIKAHADGGLLHSKVLSDELYADLYDKFY